VEWVRRE